LNNAKIVKIRFHIESGINTLEEADLMTTIAGKKVPDLPGFSIVLMPADLIRQNAGN
jgi:hypothetical protein